VLGIEIAKGKLRVLWYSRKQKPVDEVAHVLPPGDAWGGALCHDLLDRIDHAWLDYETFKPIMQTELDHGVVEKLLAYLIEAVKLFSTVFVQILRYDELPGHVHETRLLDQIYRSNFSSYAHRHVPGREVV